MGMGFHEGDIAYRQVFPAFLIEVQWLPCGTIVILSYPVNEAAWFCPLQPPPIAMTRKSLKLVLAPFGGSAKFLGFEDATEAWKSSKRGFGHINDIWSDKIESLDLLEWQKSLLSYLRYYGIRLSSLSRWARVELLKSEASSGESPARPKIIVWPCELCFFKGGKQRSRELARKRNSFWDPEAIAFNFNDPLAEAETWFLGKEARDRFIENLGRESNPHPQKEVKCLPPEEDSIPEIFPTSNRKVDTQALSSIYPTPPDGFRSQAQGATPELGPPESPVKIDDKEILKQDHAATYQNDGQILPSQLTPAADSSLGGYEPLEKDLFEDMENALYETNGITEADFSFFDPPDEMNSLPLSPLPSNGDVNSGIGLELAQDPDSVDLLGEKSIEEQRASQTAHEYFVPGNKVNLIDIDQVPSMYRFRLQSNV